MERTKHPVEDLVILTNDPSTTAWGWAVINSKGKILATGCIKTVTENKKRRIRKGDDTVRRISEINQVLLTVMKEYKVNYLISELPHGSQNASAAVMIGIVTGIVQTFSDTLGHPIEWYSEGDSKKCLLGKLSATKTETVQAIDKRYNIPKTYKGKLSDKQIRESPWSGIKYIDEAVADAIAVYNVAKHQSSMLKYMSR